MKKTYAYFLFPLIGLVIFGAVYWNFSSQYKAKEAMLVEKAKQAKKDKLDQANRDRKKAFDDAQVASDRRKKEKEAKEKFDAEQVEARDIALEQRNKALRDASTLTQKIGVLTKEVEATKKEVAVIEDDKKKTAAEQAFLRTYVKQAQDNAKGLESVLQKIKEADEALIAAKAAAEAAAKAKK